MHLFACSNHVSHYFFSFRHPHIPIESPSRLLLSIHLLIHASSTSDLPLIYFSFASSFKPPCIFGEVEYFLSLLVYALI